MTFRRLLLPAALALVVVLPFLLRPRSPEAAAAADSVVIITPHNEAIRQEFGRGFARWYRERTGRTVEVDWRVIGGGAEIARYLEGEYVAAFRHDWTGRLGRPWSAEIQAGFQNGRLPANAPAIVREAREAFLASGIGSGIDLFFGGGAPDFVRQAEAGRLVDAGVRELHPDWFAEGAIPRTFAGEEFWDRDGRWYGAVLSSFGIVFNRESLTRLGIKREPLQWSDLADPRYLGEVALCDPTKSSSIAKAFENVVQQQMQRRLAELAAAAPGAPAAGLERQAVREGWLEALRLLQLVGANARYFTDNAQKPPIDVAAGDCAAGMCIDFFGRQQQEAVRRRGGSTRLGYNSPVGGSVASVDPIGLLRGAPHRETAVAFIEYVLSLEGQKLWNFEPGTPGGPDRFALRRLPVRRDFYREAEWAPLRSDPDNPFEQFEQLIYRSAWTGGIFRETAFLIRVMCLDTHPELVRAWVAINAAPESRRTRALAALQDFSAVGYDQVAGPLKQRLTAKERVSEIDLGTELGELFRRNYARAEAIALGSE